MTTQEAKRLWLRDVMHSHRLNVTGLSDRLEWNRSDTSAMLNGTGGRGIPDDRIDEVVKAFKVPPPMAASLSSQAPVADAALREEVRELKESVNRLLSLHVTLMEAQVKKATSNS